MDAAIKRDKVGDRRAEKEAQSHSDLLEEMHKLNLRLRTPTPVLHPLLVGVINNLTIMGFSFTEFLPIAGRLWGSPASC